MRAEREGLLWLVALSELLAVAVWLALLVLAARMLDDRYWAPDD